MHPARNARRVGDPMVWGGDAPAPLSLVDLSGVRVLPGLPGHYDVVIGERHAQADNTAAANVTGMGFNVGEHRAAHFSYVIQRTAVRLRSGILMVGTDGTTPTVVDTAVAATSVGITWSVVLSNGRVQVQIAVDNGNTDDITIDWHGKLLI